MKIIFRILLVIVTISIINSCTENNITTKEQPEVLNFIGPVESFSDFGVYKVLSYDNPNIVLNVGGTGREDLDLNSEISTFSLPHDKINVNISKYSISVIGYFSDDTYDPNEEQPVLIDRWTSISGIVKLSVSNVEDVTIPGVMATYRISIKLENVIFENEDGDQKMIENLLIEEAGVGWLPG